MRVQPATSAFDRPHAARRAAILAGLLLLIVLPGASVAKDPPPRWIWVDAAMPRSRAAVFRKTFNVPRGLGSAEIDGVADFCHCRIVINGQTVVDVEDYRPPFHFDVFRYLKQGPNAIALEAASHSGPPAIALRLRWKLRDGRESFVVSDKSWQATGKPAVELGALASEPWGDHPDSLTINVLDDYTQWKQAIGNRQGADPERFFTRPGFQVELLRSAGPKEGSWVSLAFDPRGRLVVAREDRGLLRMTFAGKDRRVPGRVRRGRPIQGRVVKVETINDSLKECRGLLFAHGALYANANNSKGLYRLRDTNGDDRFDEVKRLREMPGGVGHGRNDLALGPDGMIYAIHGDAVAVPTNMPNRSSPLRKLSRKGGRGFVMRADRAGRKWEVVATGMRNPFGIAFNPDGEMFTYDADAEYDMGAPWYRPTRILHLLPGGDYGWRAVTRAWPAYDPDTAESAPPALDIGKGSPTAAAFGTTSRFPGKYRRSLFVLDWAYGRILAVHMTPRGAGYALRAETFLKGRPFNATDLGFGPDGAMYVVTGGRKTQAGLYRIRYVGKPVAEPNPTPQQRARELYSTQARKQRRRLESLNGASDKAAVEMAWRQLNHPDPYLRHAARIAIERQPVQAWRKRALTEQRPLAALTALLALAQARQANDGPKIVDRLKTQPLPKLPLSQQLVALRIHDLVLSTSPADGELAKRCLQQLDPHYPSTSFAVNKPLSELLVRLKAPGVVSRTLDLLERADRQEERFHDVYVLRTARHGWTPELRTRYFRQMRRMRNFLGGEGMPTFISRIEADATAGLTEKQRQLIAPLLARKTTPIEIPAAAKNRKFVRNWTAEELADAVRTIGRGRNFARGKAMFEAAVCSACHRIGRTGHAVGPDLTSIGRRFSRRDILESILDPSKVVAEQYRQDVVVTGNGKVLVGTILPGGDYRSPRLQILIDPLHPGRTVTLLKKDVEQHRKSKTSMMPKGLLNTLSKPEILDLLAYLESGGDAKDPLFRQRR
jgi:putative heme-binding domain-containing protein